MPSRAGLLPWAGSPLMTSSVQHAVWFGAPHDPPFPEFGTVFPLPASEFLAIPSHPDTMSWKVDFPEFAFPFAFEGGLYPLQLLSFGSANGYGLSGGSTMNVLFAWLVPWNAIIAVGSRSGGGNVVDVTPFTRR